MRAKAYEGEAVQLSPPLGGANFFVMALKRMDNVGIVVDDLGATIDFFRELGLELEGRAMEGDLNGSAGVVRL